MILRWIGFVFLVLLLLLTAYTGLGDGLSGIRDAIGVGQWIATVAQLAYGVFAILALAAMGARHRTAIHFIYGWCVATILISFVAPIVYGGVSIAIGLVSGVTGALVALLVVWIWRRRPDGGNVARPPAE